VLAAVLAVAFSTPAQQSGSSTTEQPQPNQAPADSPKPSLLTPLKVQPEHGAYRPITARQRLRWFITDTIGPPHLVGGLFTSAAETALDHPREYGPGWAGFGDRFGMRLTGISAGNATEATIGALWKEDPRYFRVPDKTFKARVKQVVRLTFMARRSDGNFYPAYARYIAVFGNNFLSNTWRANSEANTQDAMIRVVQGFAGRMTSNAFEEFWPDIKHYVFHTAKE
jgi:hypothetical protein